MYKTLLFLAVIILSFNFGHSQDYYVVDKDTVHCKHVNYSRTAQGYLKKIYKVSENGEKSEIKDKKILRNVTTLFINGIPIDRVPLKPSKPDGYVRYLVRAVDGKIKTYSNDTYRPVRLDRTDFSTTKLGSYHYTIKMPNGTWYDIKKKKNFKNYIKPFLLKCDKFKKEYKGDFSTHETRFNKTVKLYNSLCN